ncbi:hypothetical protein [uncultured Streptomyces sp.]|uniref:hypothetical protein n=1 Tax=uncultured Streptomyces sp. TaxID=174707 RepID=UPI00262A04F0|nr:hypothetical protein [uncultured Streptomyces sp.]
MAHPARTFRRSTGRPGFRTSFSGVCALLLLVVGLLASAGHAQARTNGLLDVTCTPPSSASVTYNPPLTNTPQVSSASLNWQLGPCVSTSVPALTSGTHSAVNPPRTRTCLELLNTAAETRTITWNTGATSTLSLNRTTTVAGAVLVVTFTGTVTAGLFAGDTVVATQTGPATDILLCTLGLGSVSGVYAPMVVEITSV